MRLRRRRGASASPVELRFIDLFMLIVAALVFVAVVAMLISSPPRPPAPLAVLTRTLPLALQDEPYEIYLAGRGGQPPYGWTIAGGELPEGLGLDANSGRIFGAPKSHGTVEVEVELRDGMNEAARATLRLDVRATARGEPMHIAGPAAALPEAVTFADYRHRLVATGGRAPYAFSANPVALPPGLTLTADGVLQGQVMLLKSDARLAEPWRFTVTGVDADGTQTWQRFVLPVRYESRVTAMSRVWRAVGMVVGFAFRWIAFPVLLLSLAVVVILAATGFRGAIAARWEGVRWRRTR